MTVGDLENIYRGIESKDQTYYDEFEGRDKSVAADTLELTILFDRLADHYATDNNDLTLFENG